MSDSFVNSSIHSVNGKLKPNSKRRYARALGATSETSFFVSEPSKSPSDQKAFPATRAFLFSDPTDNAQVVERKATCESASSGHIELVNSTKSIGKSAKSVDTRCAPLRACLHCGKQFTPDRAKVNSRNQGKYCSRSCGAKAPRRKANFITPDSERVVRIRANGLINMRLKLGWFARATSCAKCGRACKADFHHHDYSFPDIGFWLCRGCHMKAHFNPSILDGMIPFHAVRISPSPASLPSKGGAE